MWETPSLSFEEESIFLSEGQGTHKGVWPNKLAKFSLVYYAYLVLFVPSYLSMSFRFSSNLAQNQGKQYLFSPTQSPTQKFWKIRD